MNRRIANAVLTEEEVREIKGNLITGARPRDLAIKFKVAPETIRRISRGESWSWVSAAPSSPDNAQASEVRLIEMLGELTKGS